MRVGLMGDMHGNAAALLHASAQFRAADIDIIVQVGDLGIWPGAKAREMWVEINGVLARAGQTLLVAPGNHDDYDQIDALRPDADGWLRFTSRVWLAPRGHRTTLGDKSVLWLGGAGSVDRTWRVQREQEALGARRLWWPQEALTAEDVARAIAPGHADIMVCHDAPLGVKSIEETLAAKGPSGFEQADLEYAHESREWLDSVFATVKPSLLVHGHFHFPVDEVVCRDGFEARIFGLDAEHRPGALAVLETDDLSIEPLSPAIDGGAQARKSPAFLT